MLLFGQYTRCIAKVNELGAGGLCQRSEYQVRGILSTRRFNARSNEWFVLKQTRVIGTTRERSELRKTRLESVGTPSEENQPLITLTVNDNGQINVVHRCRRLQRSHP